MGFIWVETTTKSQEPNLDGLHQLFKSLVFLVLKRITLFSFVSFMKR